MLDDEKNVTGIYFPDLARQVFPNAKFTGASFMHVSHAREICIPVDFGNKRKIMAILTDNGFPDLIRRVVEKQFPNMEQLLPVDGFNNLVLVASYRKLLERIPLKTEGLLINPKTKNVFHRIAMLEAHKMALGFRVWFYPSYTHNDDYDDSGDDVVEIAASTGVGFRLRLEQYHTHENTPPEVAAKTVRQKAMELAIEVEPEMMELKEFVAAEKEKVYIPLEVIEARA